MLANGLESNCQPAMFRRNIAHLIWGHFHFLVRAFYLEVRTFCLRATQK
ncbi:MAG: hypothetical protein LBI18_15485 [Planctomycetaceae bacterium]|nr:hypothetical protein [Planctomycetaceae bacterium]